MIDGEIQPAYTACSGSISVTQSLVSLRLSMEGTKFASAMLEIFVAFDRSLGPRRQVV